MSQGAIKVNQLNQGIKIAITQLIVKLIITVTNYAKERVIILFQVLFLCQIFVFDVFDEWMYLMSWFLR